MDVSFSMPLISLLSAAFLGLEACPIQVEIDLNDKPGLLRIVGLPDTAVKESKDRVLHAIKNSGFPIDSLSGTIHLAPAEIKKAGAFYDLPIALGILCGLGAFSPHLFNDYLIGGELGLSGEVRPIVGALSLSLLAKKLLKKGVIVPTFNSAEAALVPDQRVIPLKNLKEGILFFKHGTIPKCPLPALKLKTSSQSVNMSAIKGQIHAKRALEIAAAGRHNILMFGPPGTGKTLLAKAFITILPPLAFEEALEVANIHSLAGISHQIVLTRPFRAPHHTISNVGMVGGGAHPKPGEISLAHKGVLFLDELPEFSRATLEVLRQPLEDKEVVLSRAGGKATFPTDVICIAAMNPCPCGYLGHPEKSCKDTQNQIHRYRSKISGPFLDRIDIQLEVPPLPFEEISNTDLGESSEIIQKRVQRAQECLKHAPPDCTLNTTCKHLLKEAVEMMSISARGYHRLLKVAQTIASLSNKNSIQEEDLLEALSYYQKNF